MPLLLSNGRLRLQVFMLALIIGTGFFPSLISGKEGNAAANERSVTGLQCYHCADQGGSCYNGNFEYVSINSECDVCITQIGKHTVSRGCLWANSYSILDCVKRAIPENKCIQSSDRNNKKIQNQIDACTRDGQGREVKADNYHSWCFCDSSLCNSHDASTTATRGTWGDDASTTATRGTWGDGATANKGHNFISIITFCVIATSRFCTLKLKDCDCGHYSHSKCTVPERDLDFVL